MAVGATDFSDTRVYYSNYGTALDLMAPGGDVYVDAGPVACSAADFQQVYAAVDGENFSDEQLATLRSAASARWFTVQQVKQLIGIFDFGDDKVEAGALLYGRTVDQ